MDIHICEQAKKASVILPPSQSSACLLWEGMVGRWIHARSPLTPSTHWAPESGRCVVDPGTSYKAEHLDGARKGLITCTCGLLQLSGRNKDTPFWNIRGIWACCKMSFILNSNLGKMSLISGDNTKTCHQETMTIKIGVEDGAGEETFAANYNDVRNVRLLVSGAFGYGLF